MGGPYIKFRSGRSDTKSKSLCPEIGMKNTTHTHFAVKYLLINEKICCFCRFVLNGRLPEAEDDALRVREIFNRMGFNDQEIVVLIGGGHVLGRCHKDRSGFDGPWVCFLFFVILLKIFLNP